MQPQQQQQPQYIICPPGFVPSQGQQVVYLIPAPNYVEAQAAPNQPQQFTLPPGQMPTVLHVVQTPQGLQPITMSQPAAAIPQMTLLAPPRSNTPPATAHQPVPTNLGVHGPPSYSATMTSVTSGFTPSPMTSPNSAYLGSTGRRSGSHSHSHSHSVNRPPKPSRARESNSLGQTVPTLSGSGSNFALTGTSAGVTPHQGVETEELGNSGTYNSINSLDGDFGLEPGVVDPSDPAANAVIAELRKEPTDRAVRARVLKLPHQLCMSMVVALDKSPGLMMELCTKDRGNILCHLIEKLGGDQCFCLVKFALDNFKELSLNQSGCIALPRILQHVKTSQREVFFEAMLEHFTLFITHPFGNYVVKHFLTTKEAHHMKGIISAILRGGALIPGGGPASQAPPPASLTQEGFTMLQAITTNKFGSHVLDDIFKCCTDDSARPLVAAMFSNQELLRLIVHDPFGNYNVQSAFRYINAVLLDAPFQSWCVSQVVPVVGTSPFQQNIMKHAVSHKVRPDGTPIV